MLLSAAAAAGWMVSLLQVGLRSPLGCREPPSRPRDHRAFAWAIDGRAAPGRTKRAPPSKVRQRAATGGPKPHCAGLFEQAIEQSKQQLQANQDDDVQLEPMA